MTLSLYDIEQNPSLVSFTPPPHDGESFVLRPLEPGDVTLLAAFLENLSDYTRRYYTLASFDADMAQEMCDAINRYDKLRFLVVREDDHDCVALFEYSLSIPEDDLARFHSYGLPLDEQYDCRMGPCIADAYQNRGLGSLVFPYLVTIAKKLGKRRMFLWGGVLADNARAIAFYEKNGFVRVGNFVSPDGKASIDMITSLSD